MNGGPSQVDTFDPKPSLDEVQRQADPARPPDRAEDRRRDGLAVQVQEVRPERHRGQRPLRQRRRVHRRHLRDPLDARRRPQSRAVVDADELRRGPPGPAEHGLVAALRPRARRTRTCPASSSSAPAGCRSPRPRTGSRPSCPGIYQGTYVNSQHTEIEKLIEHIKNTPDQARRPAAPARPPDAAQPRAPGAPPGRGPARGADPVVRAGLPDAVRGRRRLRRLQGARRTIRDLYGPGVQARQLLVARRLLERGVRYVQVYHGAGQPWDSHDDIEIEPQASWPTSATGRSPRS